MCIHLQADLIVRKLKVVELPEISELAEESLCHKLGTAKAAGLYPDNSLSKDVDAMSCTRFC
jgi:hypothetical protein